MLAEVSEGLDEALERLPNPYLEHKLDGARIQVHKRGEEGGRPGPQGSGR